MERQMFGKYCTALTADFSWYTVKYMIENYPKFQSSETKVFLVPPRTQEMFLILEWDGGSVTCNISSTCVQQHVSTLQRIGKIWSTRMTTCHIFWIWNTQLKYVSWYQLVWWGENWVTRWRILLPVHVHHLLEGNLHYPVVH